ncbi:hypothetical protein ZHAS_00019608 [Anopheles sinensis]|uniref:Uncharacterized protein n=1 Tax=Anopheles sinensis TaxID=74873 RepID=A0A084WMV0_ANOSI|nr:hypothetical protein ZHAS_00019608 [Anopheles sinensis]
MGSVDLVSYVYLPVRFDEPASGSGSERASQTGRVGHWVLPNIFGGEKTCLRRWDCCFGCFFPESSHTSVPELIGSRGYKTVHRSAAAQVVPECLLSSPERTRSCAMFGPLRKPYGVFCGLAVLLLAGEFVALAATQSVTISVNPSTGLWTLTTGSGYSVVVSSGAPGLLSLITNLLTTGTASSGTATSSPAPTTASVSTTASTPSTSAPSTATPTTTTTTTTTIPTTSTSSSTSTSTTAASTTTSSTTTGAPSTTTTASTTSTTTTANPTTSTTTTTTASSSSSGTSSSSTTTTTTKAPLLGGSLSGGFNVAGVGLNGSVGGSLNRPNGTIVAGVISAADGVLGGLANATFNTAESVVQAAGTVVNGAATFLGNAAGTILTGAGNLANSLTGAASASGSGSVQFGARGARGARRYRGRL